MRVHEYVHKATAYIGDPEKALEVRRELQAHLEEAIAEAAGHGLDSESAELIAVGRMGSPEDLAIQLAATHHTHLPWRIYLSPIPLLGLFLLYGFMPHQWNPWVYRCVWGMLVFSLAPSLATARRWLWLIYIDMVAKYHWLNRQPMRATLLSGGAGGLVAGLAFSITPAVGRLVNSSGWYEQFIPPVFWPVLARLSWLGLFAPVVPGVLAVAVARRFLKGDLVLTGAFAALAFPLGSLPSLVWLWDGAGPFIWVFFNVIFALTALSAGWMARAAGQRGLSVNQ